MKYLNIAATILVICVFAACNNNKVQTAGSTTSTENTPAIETSATTASAASLPQFTMVDMDGKPVNLSSLKGKKVFVNLWATWCPPCRAEIPSIEALKEKVNKDKVAFVMLSLDNNINLPKKYATKFNMTLPVFYPGEGLPEMFKVEAIPSTFIFNEKGELIKSNMGAEDYNTDEYVRLLN